MNWDFLNRKLKEFFENRRNQSIDKLFTLNTEASAVNSQKKPQIELETSPFEEYVPPQVTRASTVPHKDQKPLAKPFNQVTHLFSPHGPGRSQRSIQMRTIVTSTLRNDQNAFNAVKTKDIQVIQSLLKSNLARRPTQNPTYNYRAANKNIDKLLLGFEEEFDTYTSPKFSQSPTLQKFVKEVREINTMSMKAKIKTQQSMRSLRSLKVITPPVDDFRTMKFESNTDERMGVDRFLTNKWLEFIIEFKTMRRSDQFERYVDEFMKSRRAEEELLKIKQKRDIRQFYQQEIPTIQIKTPQKYQKNGRVIRTTSQDELIKHLDKQYFRQAKKIDDDNLIEFHPQYYTYKVKKRRVIQKLWALCKLAVKKGRKVRQLLADFQSNYYERRGSFAFINFVKKGHRQAVIQLLNSDQKLVHSLTEFQEQPIHLAVQRRNTEMVKILLNYNADINAEDAFQQTPLYFALISDDLEMAKLLLSYGASCWSLTQKDYFKACMSQQAKDILKLAQYMSIQSKALSSDQAQLMFEQLQRFSQEQIEKALESFKQ